MLNNYFEEKIPFCYKYFSTLIEQIKDGRKKFPQAIIFEGNDTKLQYLFTLELAIAMNSYSNNASVNEKWIKSYSHPAVNNVSQIHYKPATDKSKNYITVPQAQAIESDLKITSDYHRFFIFFSSREYEYSDGELTEFEKLGYNTDIDFSIESLEYKTFHNATLNKLLKSVEEPPKNTTFVFLTQAKENILPTITSRCQIFKINSDNKLNYNDIESLLALRYTINYANVFEFCEKITDYTSENKMPIILFLNKFALYLKDLIFQNKDLYFQVLNDIKIINRTIKMIQSNVNEKSALESMALSFIRGY